MTIKELHTNNIKPVDYENVIDFFNSNHNNANSIIAKRFGLKTQYVNFILDVYLSRKKNYYGKVVNYHTSESTANNMKAIKVYTDKGKLIGRFKSIKDCAIALGINWETISKKLNYGKGNKIEHRNGETYKYKYAN